MFIFKDETNILDGTETAINGNFRVDLPEGGELRGRVTVFGVERQERENVVFTLDGEIDEQTFETADFVNDNWGTQLVYERPHAGLGVMNFSISHNALAVNNHLDTGLIEDGERVFTELETNRTRDRESRISAFLTVGKAKAHLFKFGIDLGLQKRHARARFFEIEDGETEELEYGGVFRIEEARVDAFLTDTWQINDDHTLQVGVRLENTALDLVDAGLSVDDTNLFPSLHYLFRTSSFDQFRVSAAKTVKRPDFMDLQPFLQRDQPFEGRNTIGNPNLKPEFSLGLDMGYEHRFRKHEGMFGVNLFYRDITDRVETLQTGPEGFQVQNVGDGEVFGLEIDLGFPLNALNLPNMSLFANLTLQDSKLIDPLTGRERAFNLQSDHVINLGVLHSFPTTGISYGLNWLNQGKTNEIFLTERSVLDYGNNLEFLFEKRWKTRWALRFTARNLLDAAKVVDLQEYEGLWTDGELSQSFHESERPGRSFLLTLRGAFGNHR